MEEAAAPGVAGPSSGVPEEPPSPGMIVERWWADHFPGSPVAGVTSIWNHAFAAKEDLKRRLADLVGRV